MIDSMVTGKWPKFTIIVGPGITCDFDGGENRLESIKGLCDAYGVEAVVYDSSAEIPQTVGGFTDVKESDYFAAPVLWAVDRKITAGTSETTFSPSKNCSVAEILTFLWRAYGPVRYAGHENPFSDVKSSDYYYDAALWAEKQNIVPGGTFGGDRPCTRSMAVTYMWKAAGSPAAQAASFTDVPADADYVQAVAWAVEKGVTSGTSATTFSPDSVCTRGQIVTFLHRALAK